MNNHRWLSPASLIFLIAVVLICVIVMIMSIIIWFNSDANCPIIIVYLVSGLCYSFYLTVHALSDAITISIEHNILQLALVRSIAQSIISSIIFVMGIGIICTMPTECYIKSVNNNTWYVVMTYLIMSISNMCISLMVFAVYIYFHTVHRDSSDSSSDSDVSRSAYNTIP